MKARVNFLHVVLARVFVQAPKDNGKGKEKRKLHSIFKTLQKEFETEQKPSNLSTIQGRKIGFSGLQEENKS